MVQGGEGEEFASAYCELHNKENAYYCKTCQVETCADCCIFGSHRLHEILPYTQMTRQLSALTQQISDLLAKISQKEQDTSSAIASQNTANIQSRIANLQHQLSNQINRIYDVICSPSFNSSCRIRLQSGRPRDQNADASGLTNPFDLMVHRILG